MEKTITLIALGALACTAAPGSAQDRIDTVMRGQYACELPGNAAGAVAVPQPDMDFRIKSASRYSGNGGEGIYLFRGGTLQFTTGPRKGERYRQVRDGFMRKLDADGKESRLRCIRMAR
ncbi:elongation factor P [Paraurantiacibacter namhicola]|nr:elongation factor P [Paraurantiacibacter namhicola]